MCYNPAKNVTEDNISVKENTVKAKYEFLKAYYTKWNQIIHPAPRVIVDTHAGSGIVMLEAQKNPLGERPGEEIYGSPLLALLKTIQLSSGLTIHLNEPYLFERLRSNLEPYLDAGLPLFQRKKESLEYRSLETRRLRKQRPKPEFRYPDKINRRLPRGYEQIWKKSDATIKFTGKEIQDNIGEILDEYAREQNVTTGGEEKIFQPKILFFVDPCGIVDWSVIQAIGERAQGEEGIELILNWSWEAIVRNRKHNQREKILGRIYGFTPEEVIEHFSGKLRFDTCFNLYKEKLNQFWQYIEEAGVPRERKTKPKMSSHKKYFLFHCTNNKSGSSLAGGQVKKVKENIRGYDDITKILKK